MRFSHLLHVFLWAAIVAGKGPRQAKSDRRAERGGHGGSTNTRKFIVEVKPVSYSIPLLLKWPINGIGRECG